MHLPLSNFAIPVILLPSFAWTLQSKKAPTICPVQPDALGSCELLGSGLDEVSCSSRGGCVDSSDHCRRSPIPSLDELAGDWQDASQMYNRPSVEGFWGGVATSKNMLSFSAGTFPPQSQRDETAALSIDGQPVSTSMSKWYPYQVTRKSSLNGLDLTSNIRMGFERNLIMLQVEIQNKDTKFTNPSISINLRSAWQYESGTWDWSTPRPSASTLFLVDPVNGTAAITRNNLDSTSAAVTISNSANSSIKIDENGTGVLSPRIKANETFSMSIVVTIGNSSYFETLSEARSALKDFSTLWEQSMEKWSERYSLVFQPNNSLFSGSLPVLVTQDKPISLLWYQSAISILSTMRTNLGFPRVYATVGPEDGTTLVYAWDTALWSGILTLLDPVFLKKQVSLFLQQGVYNGYAVDYRSEKLVGPWYSANDFAIFTTMIRYVNFTGDFDWLKSTLTDGSTLLSQLEDRATHWKHLENQEFGLADYGGLSNLLEEVVTYVNMVPSLNAANVWMMNQYSYLLGNLHEGGQASNFSRMADDLAGTILGLYAGDGTGYWNTKYLNGSEQAVKHIYDFDTLSLYFSQYLNTSVKSDMRSFMQNDLYTGNWVRALSVSDLAANVSMRPDHGANGAYTSWAALGAAGMSQLGDYGAMVKYLRSFSSVLSESTWAQCYQLVDPLGPEAASAAEAAALWASKVNDFSGDYFGGSNGSAPAHLNSVARVSLPDQGELFNENNGASFADVILTYLFGWDPQGANVQIKDEKIGRADFVGSLFGLRGPRGALFEVTMDRTGIRYAEQEIMAETS